MTFRNHGPTKQEVNAKVRVGRQKRILSFGGIEWGRKIFDVKNRVEVSLSRRYVLNTLFRSWPHDPSTGLHRSGEMMASGILVS
jgi:hypothetical protein